MPRYADPQSCPHARGRASLARAPTSSGLQPSRVLPSDPRAPHKCSQSSTEELCTPGLWRLVRASSNAQLTYDTRRASACSTTPCYWSPRRHCLCHFGQSHDRGPGLGVSHQCRCSTGYAREHRKASLAPTSLSACATDSLVDWLKMRHMTMWRAEGLLGSRRQDDLDHGLGPSGALARWRENGVRRGAPSQLRARATRLC
jgi:hypothetical protein